MEITEIQRLALLPGDVVVVRCDTRLTAEAAAQLRDFVQSHLAGHKVMVLDSAMSIEVMAPSQG